MEGKNNCFRTWWAQHILREIWHFWMLYLVYIYIMVLVDRYQQWSLTQCVLSCFFFLCSFSTCSFQGPSWFGRYAVISLIVVNPQLLPSPPPPPPPKVWSVNVPCHVICSSCQLTLSSSCDYNSYTFQTVSLLLLFYDETGLAFHLQLDADDSKCAAQWKLTM